MNLKMELLELKDRIIQTFRGKTDYQANRSNLVVPVTLDDRVDEYIGILRQWFIGFVVDIVSLLKCEILLKKWLYGMS